MASYLTDEEREGRYFRLRKKVRTCDRLFGVTVIILIVFIILNLTDFTFTFSRMLSGDFQPFFQLMLIFVMCAFGVTAAYRKKLLLVLLSLLIGLLMPFLVGMFGFLFLAAMLPSIPAAVIWQKLEKEEGFPLFRISIAETQERQKLTEQRIRFRALQAGARVAEEAAASAGAAPDGMTDLLDAGDAPILTRDLHGYHARSEQAQAFENAPQQISGNMDSLEDF